MEFKSEINKECAFNVEQQEGFCSSINIVEKLKDYANKINPTGQAIDVLKEKYNCRSEVCVLNQSEIQNIIQPAEIEENIQQNFKPEGPKLTKTWLSNENIDKVLDQIQKKYIDKHFLHIPFQMIDFQEQQKELAQMDWQKEYQNGYRTFGTVINTDKYSGRGKHWFAIFGDFLDSSSIFTIEYFNSSGELPKDEIIVWMTKIKNILQFPKEVRDVVVTRIQNQYSDTECGPYSLYYIISRLDGVPMEWFKHNRIKDSTMYMFREYLFREKN
jgi:Ulp1 protease family, C-terminal catalytic domain